MVRKHWKWLAASALGVAWITVSCGASALSTRPVCTSIETAIRGLLLPIATPLPAPTNNTKTVTTFRPTSLSPLPMSANSSALCERQTKAIKSAISTAESMANSAVLTITSVYSITPSKTNICGRMIKASIHIPQPNSSSTGRTVLLHAQNSLWTTPPTQQATASKKSLEHGHRNTIYGVTSTGKPTGYCQNTYECLPDAESHRD